jgi:hypothetical protein
MNPAAILARVAIAFPSKVHFDITQSAMSGIHGDIAVLLDRLPSLVVNVDITAGNIPHVDLGKLTREDQKHHFMLAAGQKQRDAYNDCMQWIVSNTQEALTNILRWRVASERAKKFETPFDPPQRLAGDNAALFLARALHAVQDSFSAGHVHRIEEVPYVITKILQWDDQNINAGPDAGKPGAIEWDEAGNCPGPGWKGHHAYDDEWNKAINGVSNASTTRAAVAQNASADLIALVLNAAGSHQPMHSAHAQMMMFVKDYFSEDLKN